MRKVSPSLSLPAAGPGLPDVSPRQDALSWALQVLLRCPCCGRSKRLQHARDWPPGLREIQARCPDCSGHGRDSSVLSYADGRVVVEHAAPAH